MPVTQLATHVRVGPPQVSGPLSVFPLFRDTPPVLEYRSFAQAAAEGFVVKEVADGASVRDLTVVNPLGVPVLLYDGEEVLGAQQNRTLDISVLVPAGGGLTVPVSCVEAGRWDGARHGEQFAPAPQAAHPSLRAMKSRQSALASAAGLEARADQNAVWHEVAALAARREAHAPTAAMHDVYEKDRSAIAAMIEAIDRQDAQVGAVAAIAGGVAVMDYVSRSDVWAALHGPLVQGYALDALDGRAPGYPTIVGDNVDQAWVQDWVDDLLTARDRREVAAVGLGRQVRVAVARANACGLVHEDELVQLTAFPVETFGTQNPARIRRPSRRS